MRHDRVRNAHGPASVTRRDRTGRGRQGVAYPWRRIRRPRRPGRWFAAVVGRKGFYRYRGRKITPDPAVYPLADRPSREVIQAGPDAWRERMVLVMVNEGARCLEEHVVATPALLDLAMILGTGFPPFRGGLLRYADTLGPSSAVERARVLESAHGPRFAPPDLLGRVAGIGGRFRDEFAPREVA